ncbi:hypothetical protein M885DRAFT_621247 [Pelagophyceae sp. CCMP2097]|nr:hypothetical protein M885DRAFT_626730 [Pelagophyceae sp. CCMP2097]KAJ1450979.1 hypothetical protein M885DRAFT_621247 [Pelagophyceae sp. CCMP2097]
MALSAKAKQPAPIYGAFPRQAAKGMLGDRAAEGARPSTSKGSLPTVSDPARVSTAPARGGLARSVSANMAKNTAKKERANTAGVRRPSGSQSVPHLGVPAPKEDRDEIFFVHGAFIRAKELVRRSVEECDRRRDLEQARFRSHIEAGRGAAVAQAIKRRDKEHEAALLAVRAAHIQEHAIVVESLRFEVEQQRNAAARIAAESLAAAEKQHAVDAAEKDDAILAEKLASEHALLAQRAAHRRATDASAARHAAEAERAASRASRRASRASASDAAAETDRAKVSEAETARHEADTAGLNTENMRLEFANAHLAEEAAGLAAANAQLSDDAARLSAAHAALQGAHAALQGAHTALQEKHAALQEDHARSIAEASALREAHSALTLDNARLGESARVAESALAERLGALEDGARLLEDGAARHETEVTVLAGHVFALREENAALAEANVTANATLVARGEAARAAGQHLADAAQHLAAARADANDLRAKVAQLKGAAAVKGVPEAGASQSDDDYEEDDDEFEPPTPAKTPGAPGAFASADRENPAVDGTDATGVSGVLFQQVPAATADPETADAATAPGGVWPVDCLFSEMTVEASAAADIASRGAPPGPPAAPSLRGAVASTADAAGGDPRPAAAALVPVAPAADDDEDHDYDDDLFEKDPRTVFRASVEVVELASSFSSRSTRSLDDAAAPAPSIPDGAASQTPPKEDNVGAVFEAAAPAPLRPPAGTAGADAPQPSSDATAAGPPRSEQTPAADAIDTAASEGGAVEAGAVPGAFEAPTSALTAEDSPLAEDMPPSDARGGDARGSRGPAAAIAAAAAAAAISDAAAAPASAPELALAALEDAPRLSQKDDDDYDDEFEDFDE